MDESVFRQMLTGLNERPCPFGKSILTGCAGCSKAEKRNIAEREVVACTSDTAHERCIALRDLLRNNFTFALGRLHIDGPLPHAQEMRMQCGGLTGLQLVLDDNGERIDIDCLLTRSQQKFGELADFPYSSIVQLANTHYRGR